MSRNDKFLNSSMKREEISAEIVFAGNASKDEQNQAQESFKTGKNSENLSADLVFDHRNPASKANLYNLNEMQNKGAEISASADLVFDYFNQDIRTNLSRADGSQNKKGQIAVSTDLTIVQGKEDSEVKMGVAELSGARLKGEDIKLRENNEKEDNPRKIINVPLGQAVKKPERDDQTRGGSD